MNLSLLKKLKYRLIRISVSASSTRNQIGSGKIELIRTELDKILSLKKLSTLSGTNVSFSKLLDNSTNKLINTTHIKWGTARKLINICLREISYNKYLRDHLKLTEKDLLKFEIPIDSHTYKYIVEKGNFNDFKWMGIINIKKEEHSAIQKCYQNLARIKKIAPIHLDIEAW